MNLGASARGVDDDVPATITSTPGFRANAEHMMLQQYTIHVQDVRLTRLAMTHDILTLLTTTTNVV